MKLDLVYGCVSLDTTDPAMMKHVARWLALLAAYSSVADGHGPKPGVEWLLFYKAKADADASTW